MPGMIDLHCDAIEKLVEPRPNVSFDVHVALHEVDRRLAGCGITTEFHALSLDDNEFGVRSVDFARELAHNILIEPDLLVRHEIHARFEVTSQRGFEVVQRMIMGHEVQLVSIMDHSPGQGQYKSVDKFIEYIKRTLHTSDAEIQALLSYKREQQKLVPQRIDTVARLVRQEGLAFATHDDDSPERIAGWPALGVTMSEFPTTIEAARKAHQLGLVVCMGAPNVLRGRSSGDNLSALEAIREGICDALCADYYPSAMLAAVFKLAYEHILSLPEAVNMVTLNPAHALGLDDELGSLEVGKIADLVLVKNNSRHPRVQRLFVGGQERLFHA
jgi:alpha-D-ribose 1-methylphosphonate 5-triphosphate diphosphatase